MLNRYDAWKVNSDGLPVDDKERIFKSVSAKYVLRLLAYEEGVEYNGLSSILRLKDGSFWCVRFLNKIKNE